jgi:hypothetical protein
MRFARAHALALGIALVGLDVFDGRAASAAPDPCATTASISPCFDADPWWIPTGPTPFAGVPSARALPANTLGLTLGTSLSIDPVVLVTPSPHPAGQEIDVVRATSTVTLAARYGLGRGVDVALAVPFVPYQTGASTESVTSQAGASLEPVALRDPRVGFAATLLGRAAKAPLLLGTHLDLALPLGTTRALAGAAGPTLAPGFTGELALGPLDAALDVGLRFTPAVALGTVREGSTAVIALGVSATVLERPALAFAVEASLRPSLVGPPVGAPSDALDLPAEWLASVSLHPASDWSVLLGAGSGLPLSRARSPGATSESVLAVTSPAFRGVLTARYTLPSLL